MQTAEEFAKALEDECVYGITYEEQFYPESAVPLIEARDNAVRLALLEEIRAEAYKLDERCAWTDCVALAFAAAVAKYSSPVAEPSPGEKT